MKETVTSEIKYEHIQMFPLPLKWGLREICSHKVFGSQQAENVLGSAPLFCMSNKHHAVGNNVTVKLSCSAQLYSPHGGNSLSVFLGRHMYLCDSCIATICWTGSRWQVTSWISHSKWQLGDAWSTFSQWASSASSIHVFQLSRPQKQNVLVHVTVRCSGHILITLVLL